MTFVLKTILFLASMGLLLSVNWKIALGVLLFGWLVSVENSSSSPYN